MPENLWSFTYSRDASKYTLPKLVPAGSSGGNFTGTSSTPATTIVNVRDDYLWTNSKPRSGDTGRDEVPFVSLTERRLKLNSYIAQMIYSAGATKDGVVDLARALGSTAEEITKSLGGGGAIELIKGGGNLIKGLIGSAGDFIGQKEITKSFTAATAGLVNKVQSATQDDDPNFLSSPYLKSYKGLYITERTGWRFLLPYFSNNYQATANQWGTSSDTTGGGFVMGGLTELSQAASSLTRNILGTLETGAYVENSQFYQYSQSGDSLTIRFPLINTGAATYDDVVKNWQFVFLLLYNNKPERVNKNLIEPPPLYELDIPGVRYMPFTFMSGITVDYKGARRTMRLKVPGVYNDSGNNSSRFTNEFETIIPEAYEIGITITGLVTDSKNFMIATFEDKPVKVRNISQRPLPDNFARVKEDKKIRDILKQTTLLANNDVDNFANS